MKKTCLLFLVLLNFTAQATTYHVTTTGNDNDAGTPSQPFAHIQHALNQVIPGDSILVHGGVYNESLTWITSGLSSAPITLAAYSNEIPIVDGTEISSLAILQISNKSHLRISNIHFRNNYKQDAKGIYIVNEGSDIIVSQCQVYNIGWTTNPEADPFSVVPNGQAHGILVNGRTAVGISNVSVRKSRIFNIITGNSEALTLVGNVADFDLYQDTIHDTKNIGIVIAGHYSWAINSGVAPELNQSRMGTVSHCLVYDNRRFSDDFAPAGIYVDGGKDVLLHANTSYSNGNGLSIGCENAGFSASDIIVINNLIYDNDKAGIVFGSNAALIKHVLLKNNTIVSNGTLGNFYSEVSLQNLDSCQITQNIMIPTDISHYAVSIFGYTATNLEVDNNLAYRFSGNFSNLFVPGTPAQFVDTHSWNLDPLFGAFAQKDFRLTDQSPAINLGMLHHGIYQELDLDSKDRVINGKLDLGAYENQVGGCPSTFTIDSTCFVRGDFHASSAVLFHAGSSTASDTIYFHTPTFQVDSLLTNSNLIIITNDACIE